MAIDMTRSDYPERPDDTMTPQYMNEARRWWIKRATYLAKLVPFGGSESLHPAFRPLRAANAAVEAYDKAIDIALLDMIPSSKRLPSGRYQGVLKDRKGKIVWQCNHAHRNRDNSYNWQGVWVRTSATDCARAAIRQWLQGDLKGMTGWVGTQDMAIA